MDLLYHRYADPVSLLNTVVGFGDLDGFLDVMLEQADEERMWELYLHQLIKERSFTDWKASLETGSAGGSSPAQASPVTREEISETVKRSRDILDAFVPE